MSRKSKREQLNNRLENLFDEIEENAAPAPKGLAAEARTNGWVWESDPRGVYTACSPEVEQHLGLKPNALLGQKLSQAGLSRSGQAAVRAALKTADFPTQLVLEVETQTGKPLHAKLHIFANRDARGKITGYHGFTEVLPQPETAPAKTKPKTSPKAAASTPKAASKTAAKPAAKKKAAPAKAKAKASTPKPTPKPTPKAPAKTDPKVGSKPAGRAQAPAKQPEPETPPPAEMETPETVAAPPPPPVEPPTPQPKPEAPEPQHAPLPAAELDAPETVAEPVADEPIAASTAASAPPDDVAEAELEKAARDEIETPIAEAPQAATLPAEASEGPRPAHSPVPMAFQADPEGLLSLIDDNPERVWTEEERLLVWQVADQLSLALENANLFQQTQLALSETDALYQASAELNAANTYAEVLNVLLSHTLLGQHTSLLAINVFEHPWNDPAQPPAWFETLHYWNPASGITGETTRVRFSLHNLLQRDQYTFVEDLQKDTRIPPQARPFLTLENDARSAVFIPILSGNDWLGFIQALFSVRQEFQEDPVRRLTSVAGQANEKITSIYLNNRIVRRRTNADRLNTVARQMAELLSEQELRRFMLAQIFDYLQPDQVSLFDWDKEGNRLQLTERTLAVADAAEDELELGGWLPTEERPDLLLALQQERPQYEAQIMARGLVREHYRLPWRIGEQTRGVIEIYHTARSAVVSDLDQEFVEGLILQAAAAMERARLFEQTQAALSLTDEQARRLRILNELSAQLPGTDTLQEIYQLTIAKTHEIFPSERVSLTLLTEGRDAVEVAAVLGAEGQLEVGTRLPLAGTANETVVRENRILTNMDTGQTMPGSIRSYIVGPLLVSGDVIGTLNVGSQQARFFEERDQDVLQQLLSLVGAVVENRRLFEGIQQALATTEEQARRLSRLNQMSAQLGQSVAIEPMYRIAVERTREIFDADRVSLTLLDRAANEAEVVAVSGAAGALPAGSRVKISGGIRQAVEKTSIVVNQGLDATDPLAELENTLVAPLIAAGEVFGTLNLATARTAAFTPSDQDFMLQVSTLLSSTLENQRLFTQIQRRSQQLEASAEVSRVASTILDITQLLPQVVNLIKNGFDLYYCGLFLVDESGDWTGEPNRWAVLQAGTGEAGRQMLINGHKLEIGGTSMIGTAVAGGQARIALDVGAEAAFFRNPYLPETRSEMALPLASRGQVLGALTIQSEREAAFTQEDITSLQTMADLIANIIENTRLFSQTQERAEELTLLNEMARAFTQTLDVDTVIENTFEFTGRLMDADNFYLGLYHPEENEIEFKLFTEDGKRIPPPEERFKLGAGLTDRIVTTRKPLLIEENVEEYLRGLGLEPRGRPALCWLGVPMLQGEEVIGVIAVQSYSAPRQYNQHDMDLLTAVANQATVAINNAGLFQQTQARARREALLREITTRVHASADPDTILRTAVREVSSALGRETFIQLQPRRESESDVVMRQPRDARGNGNTPAAANGNHNPGDTEDSP